MSTFTIKATMPTGKKSDTYGKEYFVQFNEMEDAPALWFAKEPTVGQEVDLEKNDKGQWKKVKKEWKPGPKSANGGSATPAVGRAAYKDNSDGMRQGMCFNNASLYLNTLYEAGIYTKPLTTSEWAEAVYNFAQALYLTGDLKQQEEASNDVIEGVKDIFQEK